MNHAPQENANSIKTESAMTGCLEKGPPQHLEISNINSLKHIRVSEVLMMKSF